MGGRFSHAFNALLFFILFIALALIASNSYGSRLVCAWEGGIWCYWPYWRALGAVCLAFALIGLIIVFFSWIRNQVKTPESSRRR